ncbi:phosphatidylinositol phosphatase PTPRQ-like isoform X2 [Argiope bruennichi]|uniref:phosphatidylinositol phosphatase PTPRQ-like isoform X2 n=1 Tax=Argiope bruennichi TaxID=94029 RepID=UPI002494DB13|nr:phosphatidylinositol phosphatase PTPRQ-like isoform X2 [Argiope bruennichi]
MAGAAVLLLCVFLGLTDTTTAQATTDEPTTLPTTEFPSNDDCFAPWTVNVSKRFEIVWDGLERDATVFVNIVVIEYYGDDCLKNISISAEFHDKEAAPIPESPCFNSVYKVDVELRCNDENNTVAQNYKTEIWTEPDVPRNVHVTNVTTSSFRVVWDKPPGAIEEYKVRVNSVETSTADTYLDLRDLQPVTKYQIQVSAKNKHEWGKWSEAIGIETMQIELPTPQNLRQLSITNTTVKLAWNEVEFEDYPIFYNLRFWSGKRQKRGRGLNTTHSSINLKRLNPYTDYFIRVRACTLEATGNWTEALAVKTLPGVPSEPENLTVEKVDSVSIKLQWEEPFPFTGPIISYTVEWMESQNLLEVQQAVTNDSFYTIENLIPLTSYDISVAAETEAGVGNWTSPIQVKTKSPVPPENLRSTNISSNSISLEWEEPQIYKGRGIFVAYSVRWNQLTFLKAEPIKTTNLSMTINGLEPKTRYMFEVQGWTEKGSSEWSKPLMVETKVGVPDPPVKVYEVAVSNTSIEIKWDVSSRYKNLVKLHTVEWRQMSSHLATATNITETTFIIENLNPFTNYSIRVKSWTEDGAGEWAGPIIVQTAIGIPFVPTNVQEDEVTNTSILIKWDEPFPFSGPIEKYVIKWQEGSADPFVGHSSDPSYFIEELTPYQNYSIQVSAKTQAGFGNWSDPITVRTKPGIPFKPWDIKGENVTNTTILVKWNEPKPSRGPIELYFIEYQEEGSSEWVQKSSDVPFYLMEGLTPCKKYLIRVSAKTKAGIGNWSDTITVSTTTGLPMVPKNVKISSSKPRSLEISWEVPEPHMGNIVAYSIRWGERGSDLPSVDFTNDTYYIIRNLSAYTWYSIQVRASTEAGDGEWSNPLEGRTAIGIPSLPRNFHEKKSTNTSIQVEWEEPIPTNGPITNYTVRWANIDNDVIDSRTTNETNYLIKPLNPFTNYSVQVRAATAAGFGKWTEPLVIRTDIGVPYKPRNVTSVTVTDTSIHLKWEEPEPVVGIITRYDVECTDSSSNSSVTEKTFDYLYYIIKNLSPFTNYTIRIRAATSAGSGKWSDPIFVRTLSGVPLPPRNLEKEKVTNLTICIKWEEPSPFKGPILSYIVRWKPADSKTVETGKTEASPYCIQSLKPYTLYSIDVQAETTAGFGDWSEIKKIQTAIGIPAAVKEVKTYNKTAWTIYLNWSPPDPPNGPLKEYMVSWGEHDKPEAMKNFTNSTFFVAKNLTPYTKYIFEISASTEVGFGPPSGSLLVETEIAVPSAPVNLGLVSASNISLTLKWQQPIAPNGPILGYIVSWKATYVEGSPSVFEVQTLQHKIPDLVPYMDYSIQVSAKTSAGTGPWSDVLMASTKIGVPKPAQVLAIDIVNSKTISLEWETIPPYPGPTTFVIEVWRKSSHCNPRAGAVLETFKNGSRGSGQWKFKRPETIEGLTPYSEYYVRILLNTVVAGSISSNSSVVKTPPDSPGAPRNVEADCKESTETVVRWQSPFKPNGKIIEYLVRYGVEYSGWSEEAVSVEDECQENHSFRLRGLRPERKYKIYVRAKAKDVEENGAEASIKGYCVLPAGIPPVGEINSLSIHGSGPHTLDLDWTRNVFSDTMGDIIHYAVIIGVSEAVGNATTGRIAETFPSWSNYSEGFTSFYQATPLEWNPFKEEQEDPLHCKEIKAEEPERKTFIRCTVGVDRECPSGKPYCNGPLKPDTRYGVKLRAFTRGGFSETDPLYTVTDRIKETSSIVGVVVGVIVVFLMLSAFIAFTLILKRKGKLVELRLSILARFGRQPTAPQLPAEQVLQLEACPTVAPLTIRNFADHVRLMMSDSHLRFSQEFETLKKNSPKFPCTAAEMDENRPKNRWLNIFPYDHSRVKLLPLGDEPGSDFVNANYVPGYSSLREYIATQGPLANTVDDFWRMIWEQSVSMIVMLTQCVERGKNKCEQYWPDAGEAKHYGDMQVRTISESMLSSYIIRLFHVQLGSQERRVKQMHFTHWPDFGCPECPDDLINFIRAVRDHLPRFKPGPIVVHCSAGVGRTGTFIAVDRLSQQLRSTDSIDIFGTVMELRHHRINMVQTEDQYIYIHLCVKQLVDDINQPHESEYEEAIYSNIGMEKDTGV